MSTIPSIHHIWLRAESKSAEKRAPLTPAAAGMLIEAGYHVSVERCRERVFSNTEYERAGCTLVAAHSWPEAPANAAILGLKELPESGVPLTHVHVYFAHAYKGQPGAQALLRRFKEGGGLLLDLEYLVGADGRRVAAFGYWAGFVGAALGVQAWAAQRAGQMLGGLSAFANKESLVDSTRRALERLDWSPAMLVVGSKGRSGRGAVELGRALDLELSGWDRVRTRGGGPFAEILGYDVLVNCILLSGAIAPFLTPAMLDAERHLGVVADVSCDPGSAHNPLPVYAQTTQMQAPVARIRETPPLDVVALDHLPTLLPRESSASFCEQLLPHLLALREGGPVWQRAAAVYANHVATVDSMP